jgi:hypothetical protein
LSAVKVYGGRENVVGSGLTELKPVLTPFSCTAHEYVKAVVEAHPDIEVSEWRLRGDDASVV